MTILDEVIKKLADTKLQHNKSSTKQFKCVIYLQLLAFREMRILTRNKKCFIFDNEVDALFNGYPVYIVTNSSHANVFIGVHSDN